MERIREIHFYKDYFLDFYDEQTEKVKGKIDHVLFVISVAERIPVKFFKHIEGTDGLYEIRVEYGGNIYRVFRVLTRVNWLFYSMDSKRRLKKHRQEKLKKH